jgi:hypothetical protein
VTELEESTLVLAIAAFVRPVNDQLADTLARMVADRAVCRRVRPAAAARASWSTGRVRPAGIPAGKTTVPAGRGRGMMSLPGKHTRRKGTP